MDALKNSQFKNLINSNPQIKSVMQDAGNIEKAQQLLKDPDIANNISKLMTNPETLQKAGAMLEGLKQVHEQMGGRRRRRRKSRKRRKSTKKRRRRKRRKSTKKRRRRKRRN